MSEPARDEFKMIYVACGTLFSSGVVGRVEIDAHSA